MRTHIRQDASHPKVKTVPEISDDTVMGLLLAAIGLVAVGSYFIVSLIGIATT